MSCANSLCTSRSQMLPLVFTCDFCKDRKYCSKGCKLEDWNLGHKNICQSIYQDKVENINNTCPFVKAGKVLTEEEANELVPQGMHVLDSYEKVDMGGKAGSSLGKGAYGQVNLMCNKETNKYVALKVIEKKIVGNESMLSALQKEIEIHKKLQHDNIIRLCGHLEDESKIYLLMEYANKGNLFQLIRKKGRLTEKEAFFFFTQACSAINFLHRNMLMHRDIKPENLLLCDRGVLKLCDFGCCTQYDNQGRRTFCGTIEYMAPEIIKRGGYGEKADVWSLGILLFEMLHGYAPFHGKGDQDTISMIIGNKLKIGKDIKEDAKQLIEQILKDDPSQRPNVIEIFVYPWMKRMQSEFNIMDNVAPNSSPKKISSSEGKKQEISKNQKSEEAPQIHTNEEEKIIKKVKESTVR